MTETQLHDFKAERFGLGQRALEETEGAGLGRPGSEIGPGILLSDKLIQLLLDFSLLGSVYQLPTRKMQI